MDSSVGRGRGRGRGASFPVVRVAPPVGDPRPPPHVAPTPTPTPTATPSPSPAPVPPRPRPAGGDAGLAEGVREMSIRAQRGSGRPNNYEPVPVMRTRPATLVSKLGVAGQKVLLKSNYVRIVENGQFTMHQHHVTFQPEIDHTLVRRGLLYAHRAQLGDRLIFDGAVLITRQDLGNEGEPLVLTSKRQSDGVDVTMTVKFVRVVPSTDPQILQALGSLIRKCMDLNGFQMVGQRNYFYNMNKADMKRVEQWRVEIAPGYITGVRQHEDSLLMNVFVHHKVLRMDTVYQHIMRIKNDWDRSGRRGNLVEMMKAAILGEVVITRYNNKTYKVDDIDFSRCPTHVWNEAKGETYAQYYKRCYDIVIQDLKQPLLVSKPKMKDRRRGDPGLIFLIPEVCHLTGLTEMRTDFRAMRDLAQFTCLKPNARVESIVQLLNKLRNAEASRKEFDNFQLKLDQDLVDVPARMLKAPDIVLGKNKAIPQVRRGDWQSSLRSCCFFRGVPLLRSVIIFGQRDGEVVKNMLRNMQMVASGFGLQYNPPTLKALANITTQSFQAALSEVIGTAGGGLDLIITVLPDNKADRYATIKRMTLVENAIPSQAVLAKTISKESGLASVCSKIMQQVQVKLGGALWHVGMVPPNTMVSGFDVYHDTADKKRSAGALVCSLDPYCTRYTSSVAFHKSSEELSNNIGVALIAGLRKYKEKNGTTPKNIILYRDGVGEGNVNYVVTHEVASLKKAISSVDANIKLSVILVSKRIHTQFFSHGGMGYENPPPGTVVDSVVTNPECFDFFLIPQASRQGTVNPVLFNVIVDEIGFAPDSYQRLTFMLTHLYFNWAGTIRVPAPIQYAHKLAFLAGEALRSPAHPALADKAFYL